MTAAVRLCSYFRSYIACSAAFWYSFFINSVSFCGLFWHPISRSRSNVCMIEVWMTAPELTEAYDEIVYIIFCCITFGNFQIVIGKKEGLRLTETLTSEHQCSAQWLLESSCGLHCISSQLAFEDSRVELTTTSCKGTRCLQEERSPCGPLSWIPPEECFGGARKSHACSQAIVRLYLLASIGHHKLPANTHR